MKIRILTLYAVALLASVQSLRAQTPLSSEFTFQGQLNASGQPAISSADFQFSLFDAANGGSQIGSTVARSNIALSNGTFTVLLDFGTNAFRGDARWLEVSVRNPAGTGGFTTLAPRQPLTSTPNSTFSLQTRGINVNQSGQVGIGTATPGKRLSVAGDMELSTAPGEFRHLRIGGGESDGFLFSGSTSDPFDLFPVQDGVHLSCNYLLNTGGSHQIINNLRSTSRLSLRDGSISIATGTPAQPPIDRVFIAAGGNVGIGTSLPQARLEVQGDVRVQGDFRASSDVHLGLTDATLRIMGGRQSSSGPEHLIWKMGDYLTITPPVPPNTFPGNVYNPELRMISPVTGDELAGFYRDFDSGNGVMFADDKNFRAPNPADPATDIWYCCPEGPEAAMYMRGTAKLVNGRATIQLPDHFRNLASESGMTIQLTPLAAESRGLAAINKRLDGIEIVELGRGTGNYEFDWRVEAVRKGWENYKVIRPWLHSDEDADKAWQNRLKHIEERRAHGKPSPAVSAGTPRPNN